MAVSHPDEVFLAGAWRPARGDRYTVISPVTEQPVAEVSLPSIEDADEAVRGAHEIGRSAWGRMPTAERVAACRRVCAALEERLPEIGDVWAAEAGMPVRYSRTLHRFGAASSWAAALDVAEEALRDDVRTSPLGEVLVRREPVGVVLAVMAYNGPLVTFATKVLPALLAGNPVVVKAALESQLIMRVVAECVRSAGLPPGALSILCADTPVAQHLTADPRVDLVSLTGGPAAAQQIIEATRGRLARTHLELGGKSPALVLDDAPLERVLRSLVPGATGGAGQVCASLSRVLVSQQRHDEVAAALGAAWEGLRIGDPLDPDTQVGPLINRAAVERTEGFVARAVAAGGRILAGGKRPAGRDVGYYYEPTLVTGLDPDADLVQNEVFGPVTVLQTFTDIEDGVRLANATRYGLAASVYTSDRELALEAAARITAGSVAINTFGPTTGAPFGGRKASGWGRECGPEGIHAFTELKQIVLGPGA